MVTLALVIAFIPAHVNETTEPVDNLGGLISAVFIGALVLAINFAGVPGAETIALVLTAITVVAGVVFVLRQLRARFPLFDFRFAGRPTFWVAAVSGVIVFGSLMGAVYIGQLFLQNVLRYSPLEAGLAILPAVAGVVVTAPASSRMIVRFGSRTTLLLGFISMLLFWAVGISYLPVGISYALIGVGVGFAGTPASNSLTGSVPVHRSGMASGTADLQRDLGGAIMQSILGAILSANYAASIAASVAAAPANISSQVTRGIQAELQKSYGSAEHLAAQYPQYADAIMRAAQRSFLDGADWAYLTGIIAMTIGALVVFCFYPNRSREEDLIRSYADHRPALDA